MGRGSPDGSAFSARRQPRSFAATRRGFSLFRPWVESGLFPQDTVEEAGSHSGDTLDAKVSQFPGRARIVFGPEAPEMVAECVLRGVGSALGVRRRCGAGRSRNRRHASGDSGKSRCACMCPRGTFCDDGTQRVSGRRGAKRSERSEDGTPGARDPPEGDHGIDAQPV